MTSIIDEAHRIAIEVHGNQFRRDGKTSYLCHVQDVVHRVRRMGLGGTAIAIAWLHDVLEDGQPRWHGAHLQARGIPSDVIQGVQCLTRGPFEPYGLFIARIRYEAPERVRWIKVCDIMSNLADDPTHKQIRKYSLALAELTYDFN